MGEFVVLQQLEDRSKFVRHVTLELFETSNRKPKLSWENNGGFFLHHGIKKPNLCNLCTPLGKKN